MRIILAAVLLGALAACAGCGNSVGASNNGLATASVATATEPPPVQKSGVARQPEYVDGKLPFGSKEWWEQKRRDDAVGQ